MQRAKSQDVSSLICRSEISQVTVFARGAHVTRDGQLPQDATASARQGEVSLVLRGIPLLAEVGTFRAMLPDGEAAWRVVAVRSVVSLPTDDAPPPPLTAQMEALAQRQTRLQAELERLTQQRQRMLKTAPDPALRTTSFVDKVDERVIDSIATVGLLLGVQKRLETRMLEVEQALFSVRTELADLELEAKQASSKARQGATVPTREVHIVLTGAGLIPMVRLVYAVPIARFWPAYTLKMQEGKDGIRRAQWIIEALVAQQTGEDWNQVRLGLSTADLLTDVRLPELPSLRFGRVQATPKRGYRPPPAGLDALFIGYDRAFGRHLVPGGARMSEESSPETPKISVAGKLLQGSPSPGADVLETTAPVESELRKAAPRIPPPNAVFSTLSAPAAPDRRSMPMPSMARTSAAPPPSGGRSVGAGAPVAMPLSVMMPPSMPPASGDAPFPKSQRARGGVMAEALSEEEMDGAGEGGGGAAGSGSVPPVGDPTEDWLDFDRLKLTGAEDPIQRGRLLRVPENGRQSALGTLQYKLEQLVPSDGLTDPLQGRGQFDHRYDSTGFVRVPSDGQAHRVTLLTSESVPTLRMVSVPRERPEVFREAELRNPCDGPLLGGPVDVYVEGSLLTVASLVATDRGGVVRVGMGVEERVRVARNVRSEEESVGLLSGSTQVTHVISIEIASALGQQCLVDVLERMPVSDDRSVTVELTAAQPLAKEYTQVERGVPIRGGLLWRLLIPAGGKAHIEYSYRVVLPARSEIIGGNRRD